MPVVEFALIKLKSDCDELECRDAFLQCLQEQDEWMRQHQPHMNIKEGGHLSSLYITRTDPNFLLITAPWDSVEAHGQWIASEVNQAGFGKLGRFFASGNDAVLLFHMEPAGTLPEPPSSVLKEPLVVQRAFCDATEKDSTQRKFEALLQDMTSAGQGDRLWAGWRIEKAQDLEELVVFRPRHGVPEEMIAKVEKLSPRFETLRFHLLG